MATRSNDLTETAKPIADELYAKLGSLKRVLSAGVLCLHDQTTEMREYYMACAAGYKVIKPGKPLPESEEELQTLLVAHLQELNRLLKSEPKKRRSKKTPSKKL